MLPNKQVQRKVWQRVYSSLPAPKLQPRQALLSARARARESLRFYRSRLQDPIYGPAYEELARCAAREIAMLERILG